MQVIVFKLFNHETTPMFPQFLPQLWKTSNRVSNAKNSQAGDCSTQDQSQSIPNKETSKLLIKQLNCCVSQEKSALQSIPLVDSYEKPWLP